jgi:hypothetical protein
MPGVRVFGYVPRAMSASDVVITLPDGSQKSVPAGTTIADFVRTHIGPGLAKAALFARLDGADVDLSRGRSSATAALAIFTAKNPESLELIRHDAAHVVASVVQRLFPGTQVTIGPSTDDGFYYDFARDKPFTPDDLAQIEPRPTRRSRPICPFVRKEVTKDEALALFTGLGEKFKLEIIDDIFAKGATTLTLYSHGDWTDFCLGPARPVDRQGRRDQAAERRRRVLARRSPKRAAPAHLRHRVPHPEGPRRLGPPAGGGAQARPPQAGQGARPVRVPPGGARRGVLDRPRHDDLHDAAVRHAPDVPRQRLRRDQDPAALQQDAVGEERPLGQVPREHVPDPRPRGRSQAARGGARVVLAQADELPVAPPVLRDEAPQLPRAAAAPAHPGRAAPQRGHRRLVGADPGAAVPAGRRPHLPDGVADHRRGEAADRS